MNVPLALILNRNNRHLSKVFEAIRNITARQPRVCLVVVDNATLQREMSADSSGTFAMPSFCSPSITIHFDHRSAHDDKPSSRWISSVQHVWSSPALRNYSGDILFLDEDVVPSPDLMQAATFGIKAKSESGIAQVVALGGWGGENQVNAEIHTFTLKMSEGFPMGACAFNRELWTEIQALEPWMLEENSGDWPTRLGRALSDRARKSSFPPKLRAFHQSGRIKVIQPTLSRLWYVGHADEASAAAAPPSIVNFLPMGGLVQGSIKAGGRALASHLHRAQKVVTVMVPAPLPSAHAHASGGAKGSASGGGSVAHLLSPAFSAGSNTYNWPLQPAWTGERLLQSAAEGRMLDGMRDFYGLPCDHWNPNDSVAHKYFPPRVRHWKVPLGPQARCDE